MDSQQSTKDADRMAGVFAKMISAALDLDNPWFWKAVDSLAEWKFANWDVKKMLESLRDPWTPKRVAAATEVVAWGLAHPAYFHRLFAFTTASQEWSRWACSTANA